MIVENQTQKPGYIAEIGFGDGRKIGALASKHPDRFFIGFEVPSNIGKVDSFLPNLTLNNEGAFEGLTQLPCKSLSVAIMDLVLEDDFTVTQLQWFLPKAAMNEVRQCDLCGGGRRATEGIFNTWRKFCLTAVGWALKPNGRLYIHTFESDLNNILALLDETEFTYEYRKTTREETLASTYMKSITERTEAGGKRYEGATIFSILARKKPPEKEIKYLSSST